MFLDIRVVQLSEPSILPVFQVTSFQGFIPLFFGFFNPVPMVFPVLVVARVVLALGHFIISSSTITQDEISIAETSWL